MRLGSSQMNWNNVMKKLRVGVSLVDREQTGRKFNSDIERIAFDSAKSTGQLETGSLEGFGDQNIVAQLQSGEIIPDDIAGWSTKTILALLLLLMLFKVKKMQAAVK